MSKKKISAAVLVIVTLTIGIFFLLPTQLEVERFIGYDNVQKFRTVKNILTDKIAYEDSIRTIYKDVNNFLRKNTIQRFSKIIDEVEIEYLDLPNVFPGKHPWAINSGYIGLHKNTIVYASGSGVFMKLNMDGTNIEYELVKSNFHEFSNYDEFNSFSSFGIKDILIVDDYLYVSFTDKNGSGFNTSVVYSKLQDELNFKYLFKSEKFIERNSGVEFDAHQGGGRMVSYTKDSILLSIGEYRNRILAQDSTSMNGKIISLNIINGNHRIVSSGHRNAQGLDYCDQHDHIISTDHGPSGGDEINFHQNLSNQLNFGWPISSYGAHYSELSKYGEHLSDAERKIQEAPLHKSHKDYGFSEPIKHYGLNPGIAQVQFLSHDDENITFMVSTMGHSHSQYIRSILLFSYNIISESIELKRQLFLNERVRDLVYDEQNHQVLFVGETTGIIGKFVVNDLLSK